MLRAQEPDRGKAGSEKHRQLCQHPAPDAAGAAHHLRGPHILLYRQVRLGQRKDCEAAVARLGGESQSKVTTRLDYLVIGFLAMRTGCTPPSAARSSRRWISMPRGAASVSFPRTPRRRPCARRRRKTTTFWDNCDGSRRGWETLQIPEKNMEN